MGRPWYSPSHSAPPVCTAPPSSQASEPRSSFFSGIIREPLAGVINLLDPDVIVLGGGMSNVERLYASVPGHWKDWVFSDRVDTRLVRNRHGDSSGVRGAARNVASSSASAPRADHTMDMRSPGSGSHARIPPSSRNHWCARPWCARSHAKLATTAVCP